MCGVRPANIQHSYHNHPTPLKSGFAISYNKFLESSILLIQYLLFSYNRFSEIFGETKLNEMVRGS
jgi:hypothetical protein